MKKILPILIAIIAFSACHKNDTPAPTAASVMFVNGSAGTTALDVSVGIAKQTGATNIAFLKNSGYQNVAAGTDSIAFILTALGTPLKSSTQTLAVGVHYSIFAGGLVTGPTFVLLTDDLTAPTSGNAKVRFINLSTDVMSVNAYVGSTVIASSIGSQGSSSFVTVPASSYIIKAGDPSNISTVISTGSQQLSSGKIYTVMLTGTLNGSGTSGLTLTVINNN